MNLRALLPTLAILLFASTAFPQRDITEPQPYSGYHDDGGTPFPMTPDPHPVEGLQDCAGCLSYRAMMQTIDTMMSAEWQLLHTFNRHWHPSAPAAGRTHTHEELNQLMINVMVDNSFRWARLIDEWVRWTGIPASTDTIPCEYTCTDWGPCVDGVKRRSCVSNGHCHIATDSMPVTIENCSLAIWATDFETVGQCTIIATGGSNVAPKYGGVCPVISDGVYYARAQGGGGYNEAFPVVAQGVTQVYAANWTELGPSNYQVFLEARKASTGEAALIRKQPSGKWVLDLPGWQNDVELTPVITGEGLTLNLPYPVDVTSLFGPNPWPWSATSFVLR